MSSSGVWFVLALPLTRVCHVILTRICHVTGGDDPGLLHPEHHRVLLLLLVHRRLRHLEEPRVQKGQGGPGRRGSQVMQTETHLIRRLRCFLTIKIA